MAKKGKNDKKDPEKQANKKDQDYKNKNNKDKNDKDKTNKDTEMGEADTSKLTGLDALAAAAAEAAGGVAEQVKDEIDDQTTGGSYDFELLPCQKATLKTWVEYEPDEEDDEECDPVKACYKKCQEMGKLRAKFCMEKRKELMEQLKEFQCTNTGCKRTMKRSTPCSRRRTTTKKYSCSSGACSRR